MSVQAVLFDFGGTLDSPGITWLDRFLPLYRKHGIEVTRESFARAFYDSDDALAQRFNLQRLGLEETLHRQVQCVLQVLSPHTNRTSEAAVIANEFVSESRKCLNQAKLILDRLRLNYRLGIVSNFYGNLEYILKTE